LRFFSRLNKESKMFARKLLGVAVILAVVVLCSPNYAYAQRRGIQIGGPNGLVIGGGNGFRAGGRNGVQFGGREGARFGPRGTGVQFGGGVGARFGPDVQFGGRNRYGYAVPSATPNYYPGVYPAAPSGATAGYVNAQPNMNAPTPVRSANQSVVSTAPEMIVLRYPESAKRSLNYTINGTPFQLAPGNTIQMQSGLNWEIGLPSKNGQSKSFKLVEAGTYPLTQTKNGWAVDAEPVQRIAENTILAPTPAGDVNEEAAEPAVKPAAEPAVKPAVFNEESNEPPPAPEMKSILELNKK
jgi:hypothetical protein